MNHSIWVPDTYRFKVWGDTYYEIVQHASEVACDFWGEVPYTIHIEAEAEHSMSGDIPIIGADVITERVTP